MKSKIVVLAATAVLALGPSTAAPGATPKAAGHCKAGEQVVLSCAVKGGKVMSLCAAGTLPAAGAPTKRMQYRFGRMGAPELVFPAQLALPRGRFFFSGTGYAGGFEERIRFANGGYDYLIFQSVIAGEWFAGGYREHIYDAGVAVLKAGKVVGMQLCQDVQPDQPDGFRTVRDMLQDEPFATEVDTPCCDRMSARR